jgi:hypothetical protein
MATLKNAPKGAIASAAEVLVNAQSAPATDDDSNWIPATEGFIDGRYGLAKDPEVRQVLPLAMKATDAAATTWAVLADILYGKGIRAGMLTGKDMVEETRNEVQDVVTVTRFGNVIAAVYMRDGQEHRISAVEDLRASEDRKSIHWKMMSEERKDLVKVRAGKVRAYMSDLIEQLRRLETAPAKGKQPKSTLEERYLTLLGPVLLFLQGIDLTKEDPKFEWRDEFDAISAAVDRAKTAKKLAVG